MMNRQIRGGSGLFGVVLITMLAASGVATAQTAAPTYAASAATGEHVFKTYCAACHGTSARGDGPIAASLKRRPSDLTEIAKRNGWTFPSDVVFQVIDGRQPTRGHGGPDMPAWFDIFRRSSEGGDEHAVHARISALVKYLESIQTGLGR
jgi:mono/diheme cytochrome c family protein